MDAANYEASIGRTEVLIDTVQAGPTRALAAALDQDPDEFVPRAELPPLWLWLYFLPVVRASQIGPDGHPQPGACGPAAASALPGWCGSATS
jgi:3-methylfumaryl-CoA hydratase